MKAQDTSELFFQDVRVPRENLLGEEGRGFVYLMQDLPQERLSIAVGAVANAQAILDATVDYTKDRKAFGKTVASFQNTQFKLAELAAEITSAEVFCVVPTGQFAIPLSSSNNRYYPLLQNNGGNFQVYIQGANGAIIVNTFLPIAADVWYNFIITGDGTTPLLYINGTQYTFGSGTDRTDVLIGDIGARPNGSFDLDGDMSNVAIWSGTTLSSTEVTEVYNQGVPSNLNTFSGTKPTAWWQLGSNSSFNATTSQWTCLDEIGTNNAVSLTNMANDDITNGVGYSANGLGTSSIEIIGDAPYSTANGISENMDVLDRTTDVPS